MSHSMSIMNHNGDDIVTWDPEVTTEEGQAAVQEAERLFRHHTRELKMMAFVPEAPGRGGSQIREFDPLAERIVLVPNYVGG